MSTNQRVITKLSNMTYRISVFKFGPIKVVYKSVELKNKQLVKMEHKETMQKLYNKKVELEIKKMNVLKSLKTEEKMKFLNQLPPVDRKPEEIINRVIDECMNTDCPTTFWTNMKKRLAKLGFKNKD